DDASRAHAAIWRLVEAPGEQVVALFRRHMKPAPEPDLKHIRRLSVPRSPFLVLRSSFSVPRSPFLVLRSSFSSPRSPFLFLPSSFSVPRSPFLVLRSSFSVPRSSFLRRPMQRELSKRLLEMADEDRRVRAELAADGSLFDGYHP